MTPVSRRFLRGMTAVAAGALVLAAGIYLARRPLTRAALGAVLRDAGASDVRLRVAEVSPWRVELADVGLTFRRQPLAAGRVTIDRPHWWSSRLGAVKVERTSLVLDERAVSGGGSPAGQPGASVPPLLPAELSVDGTLAVTLLDVPGGKLDFKFAARDNGRREWEGRLEIAADGLAATVDGTYRLEDNGLTFRVPEASLDLARWQSVVQHFAPVPDGPAELAGALTASGEGSWVGGKLAAHGRIAVRDGRFGLPARKLTASGVAFAAEFTDFLDLQSQPGSLRVAEVRVGELALTDLDAEIAFEGRKNVAVARASFQALGGTLSAEPFALRLDRAEVAAVVMASGLDIEQITALAKDLPAQASGRVDGRLPIRIDATGLKFGTGWLALKPGVSAELQFNARGLLTQGNDPKSAAYAILEQIESGLLRLKVGEMRLDIYPPGQPAGRSATLHVSGEPADPKVKAPVTLDLNVNGPLEKLISLGLDSRVGIGAGK